MRVVAIACVASAACGFRPGGNAGDGGADVLVNDTQRDAPSDGVLDGPPPRLITRGLVARYMIAEAAAGQGPTMLADVAPNPFHLAVGYDGDSNMSFTAAAGHRGMAWSQSGSTGRAKAAIGNSKIATRLGGAKTWTLETVVDIANCSSTDCRVVTIATDVAGYGSAALIVNDSTHVSVYLDGAPTTFAQLAGVGRIVIHAVVDTTAVGGGERVQLYVNGVTVTNTGGGQPAQNATLTLGAGDNLVLGNVDTSDRSFAGSEFYAALYDVALTPTEVTAQVAALSTDDDTP